MWGFFMKWLILSIVLLFFGEVISQGADSVKVAQANELYKIGKKHIYKNLDSACYYFKKSHYLFKEEKDWFNSLQALKGISFASSYHYDLDKFNNVLSSIDSILELRTRYFDSLNIKRPLICRNFLEKANYHTKVRNYKLARENSLKVIDLQKTVQDSLKSAKEFKILSSAYEYAAGSYKHEGEYTKAEELYKKSLRISQKHLDENFALPTYRLLGDLYRKKGEYAKSNQYLIKKLDQEMLKGASSKNRIVKSCFAVADNHIQLQQQDSALHYLQIANKQLFDEDPLQFQYYEVLGKTYLSQKEYQKAVAAFDKAIALSTKNGANYKKVALARLFSLKAEALDQASQYIEALQNYQSALSKLVPEFQSKEPLDNPEITKVQNKYEYLKILIKKAATLQRIKDAKGALQTSEMAIAVMDTVLPTFENKEDKQFLINTFYPVFEIGMSAAFQLYSASNDDIYIDTAFFLSEKSKSTILLEAVLNSKAYAFANIPEKILEKERQLKASIIYLQKKVTGKKNSAQWEDRLLKTKEAYANLIKDLERTYPSYYNLKYNNTVIDIDDFQTNLQTGDLAISYLLGEQNAYLIALSNTDQQFIKIEQTYILDKEILGFYQQLMTPASDVFFVKETAQKMYARLFGGILEKGEYHNLIVIPDGKLHYIPFESLYDGKHYMLENYTIGYANSTTLLTQLGDHQIKSNEFLGFAPSFSKKYPPLVNADKEVDGIKSMFDGEVFKGNQATKEMFTAKSPLSNIVHLATHAIINDQVPENSHLVFSPDSQEEILNISDIYGLPINASLVALSACETGIGSLQKGEGMISLSRAFFYAGARSIANTKWQINDRSTADIMQDFYQGLADGKKKDEALRLAKLNFLKNNDNNDYKHPYYWSGLVITGSTLAIHQKTPMWIWVGITLVMLLIGFILFRKRGSTFR